MAVSFSHRELVASNAGVGDSALARVRYLEDGTLVRLRLQHDHGVLVYEVELA